MVELISSYSTLLQLNSSNLKYYYDVLRIHGIDTIERKSYNEEEQDKIQ